MGIAGYYVGYAIAKKYYDQSKDKKQAIKKLIELDYQSKEAIEQFVNKTGYFDKSLLELKVDYEANRPRVLRIAEFENGAQDVDSALTKFTIEFSQPIDDWYRSTDFGELGKAHFPAIKSIDFSEDGNFATYHLKGLEANKQYQMLITSVFRSRSGASPLMPYALEFRTGEIISHKLEKINTMRTELINNDNFERILSNSQNSYNIVLDKNSKLKLLKKAKPPFKRAIVYNRLRTRESQNPEYIKPLFVRFYDEYYSQNYAVFRSGDHFKIVKYKYSEEFERNEIPRDAQLLTNRKELQKLNESYAILLGLIDKEINRKKEAAEKRKRLIESLPEVSKERARNKCVI